MARVCFKALLQLLAVCCYGCYGSASPAKTGVNIFVAKAEPLSVLELILDRAKPGDRFTLPKSVYPGPVIVRANGTAENPIVILGGPRRSLVLGNGKAPALTILGSHWRLRGFNITCANNTGLQIIGDDVQATNLIISNTAIGVEIKGKQSVLSNSTIKSSATGLLVDQAENVKVTGNSIRARKGTCISITSDSENGLLDENKCEGAVKNHGTVLEKNTIGF